MSIKNYKKAIPHGWQLAALGSVADPEKRWGFTGGPFGSNLKQNDYTDEGVRIIQLQNIGDGYFIDNYRIFTSASKADELLSCNIYPGEIILSKMGDPVARACLIPSFDERYLMASDGIRLSPNKKNFNSLFVLYAINSKFFRSCVERVSTGSTRKRISLSVLKSLPLAAPSLQEQNRIVAVLETWDQAIEKLKRKIKLKKDTRKGLMHGVLSGKIRLPEFTGSWSFIKLKDIGTFKGGSGFPEKFQGKTIGRYPFFKVSDMNNAGNDIYMLASNNWIDEDVRKEIHAVAFPKNTIVFAKIGAALFLERKRILTRPSCLDNNMMGFVIHDLNHEFIFYKFLVLQLGRYANTAALPSLSGTELSDIEIKVPSSKDEQYMIANILTIADKEIQALEHKLEFFKALDQHLLC